MKSPSIAKNYVYDSIYHLMTFFIPLITTPYLARVLHPDGVGIFSYVLSIQTYFSMFAALGTSIYGARVISQSRDEKKQLSINFWSIEILTIVTSFFVIVAWLLLSMIYLEYRIYFLILTLNILATTFDISWFFSGLELFKTLSFRNTFFKMLGAVLMFVYVKQPSDLTTYILIYSLIALLSSLSLWIKLKKYIEFVSVKEIRIKHHFKETLIYFLPTVATSVYTILDKTLIGLIVKDPNENGFYEQANQIVNISKTIAFGSINTVFGTRLSYLYSKGNMIELKNKLHVALDFIFLLGYALFFGVISLARDFVVLYFGTGYEKVADLLYCLMPVLIIISISSCLGTQYYIPVGKRLLSAKYLIYGSVLNFTLNIIFIPRFKSFGACFSTIIAEIVIMILYIMGCDNYLTWRDIWEKSKKKITAGISMMIVVVCVRFALMNVNCLVRFIICFSFATVTYMVILFSLKDVSVMEIKKELINYFRRRHDKKSSF